jgi:small GTP-binding protein
MGGAYERGGPRRVALVGRPNVGKSSLLNKLVGHQRVVVDDVAGTTRDPVDELVSLGGRDWRFVDTAGIRRRVHQTRGSDFYASLRTQTALEKAEVAVVLVDASETISEQDVRVIQQVIDAGRALVIAYNKWDLTDEERRHYLEREIERDLVQIPWAPRATSRPAPVGTWTGSCRRSTWRWSPGAHASPPGDSTPSSVRSSPATRTPCVVASSPASSSRPRRAPAAAVRPLRVGLHRGRLPALHRAPPARGVRLRRHADRDLGAGAREALAPLTPGRAGAIGSPRPPWDMVSTLPRGGKPRAVAQLGSALDWGSRGLPRSGRPEQLKNHATGCGAAW